MNCVRPSSTALIADHADQVVEVDLGSEAVLVDVDTPEALANLRGKT